MTEIEYKLDATAKAMHRLTDAVLLLVQKNEPVYLASRIINGVFFGMLTAGFVICVLELLRKCIG